jgi:hypothetical protein
MLPMTRYLPGAGTLPAIAFSAALALAHDSGGMMDRGGITGGDNRGEMMGGNGSGEMMGNGMGGCMQMMQGMRGGTQPPNEQWRRR